VLSLTNNNISPNLLLCGLSGTLYIPTLNGIISGNTNESILQSSLTDLLSLIPKESQAILFTQVPPAQFDTAIIREWDQGLSEFISFDMGSRAIREFLSDITIQRQFILHIHGNNPNGLGTVTYGDLQIINPGDIISLNSSKKSFTTLQLVLEEEKWTLQNWKFHYFGKNLKITPNQVYHTISNDDIPYKTSTTSITALVLFFILLISAIFGGTVFIKYVNLDEKNPAALKNDEVMMSEFHDDDEIEEEILQQ